MYLRERPVYTVAFIVAVMLVCHATATGAVVRAQAAPPPSECFVGCAYAEAYVEPAPNVRLRIQGTAQCGNGCGRFYWISNAANDAVLLAVTNAPGGNWLYFSDGDRRGVPIHTLVLTFDPDPPLGDMSAGWYTHREYRWDATTQRLIAPPPTIVTQAEFPRVRDELTAQGFAPILPRWIQTP
jgi:hypothetical protein